MVGAMSKTDRAFRTLAKSQPENIAELLRILTPHRLPTGASFTPDDLAPTQVDALPQALDADCVARVGEDETQHIEFQGYGDKSFSERCVWYHVGLALLYRGKRRVRTTAIWLVPLPRGESRNVMRHNDISVRVKSIVLPKVPAAKLLANPKTACFASGANAGVWSDKELCLRVAASLRASNASWSERHVAVVAALSQRRYEEMVSAMEVMQLEPVVIEDLVKFGEDRGFERGVEQGLEQGLEQGASDERLFIVKQKLGRPLTATEEARLAAMPRERVYEMLFQASQRVFEEWLAAGAPK